MYNTNNPVEPNGSTDPRDLGDNAQVLDLLLNSEQIEVTGRTGKKLKGFAVVQAIITSLDLGSFTFADTTSGLAGTTDGQYFRVINSTGNKTIFDYYKNEQGSAVYINSVSSSVQTQELVESVSELSLGIAQQSAVNVVAIGNSQYYDSQTCVLSSTANNQWFAFKPVDVTGMKELSVSGVVQYRTPASPIVYVNSAGGVVGVDNLDLPLSTDDNSPSLVSEKVSIIPDGAAQALITSYISSNIAVYLLADYLPRSIDFSALGSVPVTLNWMKNTIFNPSTGLLEQNIDDYCAAVIDVTPGRFYSFTGSLKGRPDLVQLVTFLKKDGSVLSGLYQSLGINTQQSLTNVIFRVPLGATQAVITAYAVDGNTVLNSAEIDGRGIGQIGKSLDVADQLSYATIGSTNSAYWSKAEGRITPVGDVTYHAFNPIPVKPGESYRLATDSFKGNSDLVTFAMFKDNLGNIIDTHIDGPGGAASISVDVSITAPENSAVLLVTTSSPTLFIMRNDTNSEKLAENFHGIIKMDLAKLDVTPKVGFYWNQSSGVLTSVADSNFRAYEIDTVLEGESYRIKTSAFTGNSTVCFAIVKNATGAVISKYVPATVSTVITSPDVTVTIPTGGVSLHINSYTDDVTIIKNLSVEKSFVQSRNQQELVNDLNLLRPSGVTGFYWHQSTGVLTKITGDLSFFASNPIAVTAGDSYRVITPQLSGNPAYVYLALFKDTSGAIVGRTHAAPGSSQYVAVDEVITVPANAVTMHITVHSSSLQIIKTGSLLDVLPGSKSAASTSHWKGKKIVWLGTSIPAGAGTNAYPYMLAQRTGANIVNQSVGSSPIRGGLSEFVTESDPYGWSGSLYSRVTRALSHTAAIKQSFIDNYDSKWKAVISGGPATLSDSEKAAILSYSFENRLAGNLDADLYVIDHGINDYLWLQERGGNMSDLLTPSVDSRDINNFYGGQNVVIDYILKNNPRARILLIGFYEDNLRVEIAQMQSKSAALWQYPLVKMWEKTGWSQQKLSSGKTITEFWLPDNLHPHKDTTGAANTLLTDIIELELNNAR